jgi:cohesin loading factor subunit SCC2
MDWQHWQSYPHQYNYDDQQTSTTASVQSSHDTLSTYPMASATPSNHVARHLNNMTLVMNPPHILPQTAYIQDHYQQPPPYTEYPEHYPHHLSRVSHAAASPSLNVNADYRGRTTDYASMLISQPTNNYYPPYHMNSSWPSVQQPSTHPSLPFPRHIIQHVIHQPYAYPTPPRSSSSSLAFALGPPPSSDQPTRHMHTSTQSQAFYEDYLNTKTSEMAIQTKTASSLHPLHPSRAPANNLEISGRQDPLELLAPPSSSSRTFECRTLQPIQSPKKRKSESQMNSPSIKRVQIQLQPQQHDSLSFTAPCTEPTTPRTQRFIDADGTTPTSQLTPGRTYRLAYVQVPPKPWLTPTSAKGKRTQQVEPRRSPDQEYSTNEENDEDGLSSRVKDDMSNVKSSSRRTGDRDDRAPLEKLNSFFEDLFEAEDTISPDSPLTALNSDFFSSHTSSTSEPLLNSAQLGKATKLFSHLTRSSTMHSSSGTSPRRGRVKDMDSNTLSRFLKIVERSIKAGEDIEPLKFIDVAKDKSSELSEGKKTSKKLSRLEDTYEADINLDALKDELEVSRDSVLAAETVLAVLTSDRLPKEV